MTSQEPADAMATILMLRAERDRLRYVLEGVRGAIDTGRNEPLQIWRDQINIALSCVIEETPT